ncbi:MAG: hypothetical protein JWO66_364 [Candidatus Eremiobacteraeota bacterium]|jgi:hypothetical protein|nr:hypothetical protein [Candidatus Eremiobacteraeota bacterium]
MSPLADFKPGPAAWTLLVLAVLSGFACVALGGHPIDGAGSVGGHGPTVAVVAAILAVSGAIVAGARDFLAAVRDLPRA